MNLGMGIAEKNGLRLSEMDLDTQYLLLTWIDNKKKTQRKLFIKPTIHASLFIFHKNNLFHGFTCTYEFVNILNIKFVSQKF